MEELLTKLEAIGDRFREVEKSIGDPDVIADNNAYRDAMREYRRLEPIADHAKLFRGAWQDLVQAKEWASSEDEEFRQMGREEVPIIQDKLEILCQQAREMLLPRDEADDRDVMLELRAGTGGDEAAIFAGELLRMYIRHIESKGWKHTFVSSSEGTVGGFKEAVVRLSGEGWYETDFKKDNRKNLAENTKSDTEKKDSNKESSAKKADKKEDEKKDNSSKKD